MRTDRVFCVIIRFFVAVCLANSGWIYPLNALVQNAAVPVDSQITSEKLQSGAISQVFAQLTDDFIHAESPDATTYEQAVLYAMAAMDLNINNRQAIQGLLDLTEQWPDRDYSSYVLQWLIHANHDYTDWRLFKNALTYVFDHTRVAYRKEQIINQLLELVSETNQFVRSELLVMKATLAYENNNELRARDEFHKAYQTCKYNKTAFMRMVQLGPEQIKAQTYFEHLRYVVQENPLDLDAALIFAQYSERLELYSLAAGAYKYCADLYQYLNPEKELPAQIYLPWAITSYNSKNHIAQVKDIVDMVRKYNRFDLFVESIGAKAEMAQGDQARAQAMFAGIEQRAEQMIRAGQKDIEPKQMAWYYCFVHPDEAKALDWANRVYSNDPNSVAGTGLLSYALIMNDQFDWAKPLAARSETQISQVSQAILALAGDRPDEAATLLHKAIVRDPSSFVAEFAKKLLKEKGIPYKSQIQTNDILVSLAGQFDRFIVPIFEDPEKRVSVRFDSRQKNIDFGESMAATVSIVNSSKETILISDDSFVQGDIRIDATVRGVISEEITGLVQEKLFSRNLVPPGKMVKATVRLDRGRLKRILESHPQAVLDIDFTLHLNDFDTETDDTPRLSIDPVKMTVHRPGVVITTRGLNNQYNAIVMSDASAKVATGKLFLGLLREQAVMAEQGPLYHFRYADWMPGRLTSAFSSESGLLLLDTFDQWETKTELMVNMLGMEFNGGISTAVARHLRNPAWPVRMAAISVLASSHGDGLQDVLEWAKQYDRHPLVKRLADSIMKTQ